MQDYEAKRLQERNERLATIARRGAMTAAIAEHLGKGWETERKNHHDGDPTYNRDSLTGPNGEDISVELDGYRSKGRYEFRASFPRSEKGNRLYGPYGKSFSITAAEGKTADQLAKEIERRLLKGYRPELAKAFASKLEDEMREVNQENAMDRLQEAVGLPGNRHSRSGYNTETRIHFYTDGPSGTFQSYDGKQFQVDLRSIPYEMAMQIAAMLRPGVADYESKRQPRVPFHELMAGGASDQVSDTQDAA